MYRGWYLCWLADRRLEGRLLEKIMDQRACIEAIKQLAGSDDTNRDQVVRKYVKDFIRPAASDLYKQLQALSEDIDAEAGTVPDEHWNYAKIFVQSMIHYMDAEMLDGPE
jgi:predicted lipoprotein